CIAIVFTLLNSSLSSVSSRHCEKYNHSGVPVRFQSAGLYVPRTIWFSIMLGVVASGFVLLQSNQSGLVLSISLTTGWYTDFMYPSASNSPILQPTLTP